MSPEWCPCHGSANQGTTMHIFRFPVVAQTWARLMRLFDQHLPRDRAVRAIDRRMRRTKQTCNNTALLMLEIDHFRRHETNFSGSEIAMILRKFEDRLQAQVSNPKALLRLGSGRYAYLPAPDEFHLPNQLAQLAKTLQAATKKPIAVRTGHVSISFSVGYATEELLADPSGAALFDAAAIALFEAGTTGSAKILGYTADMQERIVLRNKLIADVAPAIESGAIHAFFQPQINIQLNTIIGFEALARWKHDERGMISPAEFLPVLSQLGMMRDLGLTILRAALSALHGWDKAGFDVPTISINMSAEELRNPHLVDSIALELDRFDLTPERLVIEVLETVVAADKDDMILRNIKDLSALGCTIDLDDFGTGQASITSIRQFGVDRIKIDRSFIRHVDTDTDQQDMILAMLTMTERLRVGVLAEGVETPAELAFISDTGCHLVQGYAVSRPMAGADVGRWINERLFHASFAGKQQYIQ